jgi:hypothetical protein
MIDVMGQDPAEVTVAAENLLTIAALPVLITFLSRKGGDSHSRKPEENQKGKIAFRFYHTPS